MPAPARLDSTALSPGPSQDHEIKSRNLRELVSLAASGLVAMFDANKQLFCHRLLRTDQGVVREGLSPRYTIMTLLGLKELEHAGVDPPFDTQAIYSSFVRNTKWIQQIGDLGLLVWLTATFDPDRLENLFLTFDCETALYRYSDAQESRTMELAWFLAGLAHAAETSPKLVDALTDLSAETYHRLAGNQGEYGLFAHMSPTNSLAGRLRGRIGSFADQVYPIYAISKFAKAFQVEDTLGPALKCATAVCGAQGESGQWWWLYDAGNGRVSSRYPVYSVHQHGMGPMALLALEEITGHSFKQFIRKGLSWIYGTNELGFDMRDGAGRLIWRCILPSKRHTKYLEVAMNIARSPRKNAKVGSLKILYEQRPYEYGWLLFALAKHSETDATLNAI